MTGTVDLLTADTVAQLLTLADLPGAHAVAVVGSAARGDAGAWSDIDVHAYVRSREQVRPTRPSFLDGRLVMLACDTIEGSRAELSVPERAIWAVPAFRDMRILLDREGQLLALKRDAEAFDWSVLRAAAELSQQRRIADSAEFIYKIRAALERHDESAVLHAAGALIGRCTRAVVTARGVFIRTENEYYRRAQDAAGPEWTRRHRECFGLGPAGPVALDAFAQGQAACGLFAETAKALDDILDEPTRDTIRRALAAVE